MNFNFGIREGTSTETPIQESVAQSVEQRTFNPWVEGSSPSALTWEIELESPPFPREGGAFFISARPFGCRLNVNGLLLIFV